MAMCNNEEIGNVEKMNSKAEFEWKIPEFFSVAENVRVMQSPSFIIADTEWYFQLHYEPRLDIVYMPLVQAGNLKNPVKYHFGLKKMDSGIHHSTKGFLNSIPRMFDVTGTRYTRLADYLVFNLSEIQQRKSELAPSNVLTVTCILKCKTAPSHQENLLKPPKDQKLSNVKLLSENIKGLFTGGQFCDVTLRVKDKEFKAHKIILSTRSPVFASYFKHETLEKQTGIINIPDCDPYSFKEFLKYLYSGKLVNTSLRSFYHLYRTADKYDVQDLKMFCAEYMKRNLNVQCFCDVLVLADVHDDGNLFASAKDFFNSNLGEIFATDDWTDLMKNNHNLANRLLMQMSQCVQVVAKRPKLE